MSTLALSPTKHVDVPDIVGRILATEGGAGATVARVVLGGVMFPHAAQKAFGWFGGTGFGATVQTMSSTLQIPAPLAVIAIVSELVGALSLLTGTFAKLGALLVTIIMTVAILLVHRPNGFFMNWNGVQPGEGFEFHLLAIGLAIVTLTYGAGRWSVDRWLTSPKAEG
jgi:putative oxidoreductase